MKESPLSRRTGLWRDSVERLASVLRCSPGDLFSERQIHGEILATTVSREIGEEELLALSAPEVQALVTDQSMEKLTEDRDIIAKLLTHLSPKQRDIVAAHYGIGGTPKTLHELAEDYGVSVERIRQHVLKAQLRMRSALYRKYHLMSGERYHELHPGLVGMPGTVEDEVSGGDT